MSLNFPSNPSLNQVYSANGNQWFWDGSGWVSTNVLANAFTYSENPPSNPRAGDRWVDSTTGLEYTAINDGNSTQWVVTTSPSVIDLSTFNSPAFSGIPTAPTATPGTNTTQIATTAFVSQAIASPNIVTTTGTQTLTNKTLVSPVIQGDLTAPTASPGTNTTQVATTQFVQTAVSNRTTTGRAIAMTIVFG